MTLNSLGSGVISIHFQVINALQTFFTCSWIYEQQNTYTHIYFWIPADHSETWDYLQLLPSFWVWIADVLFIIDNVYS